MKNRYLVAVSEYQARIKSLEESNAYLERENEMLKERIRDLEEECIDSREDVDLAREAARLLSRVFWND